MPEGRIAAAVVIGLVVTAGCTSGPATGQIGARTSLPLFVIPSDPGNPGFAGRYPRTISFSGDGGNDVIAITWSSWESAQAVGHGTWTYQNCIPACAGGSHTPYPATITLSQPVRGKYTKVVETTSGAHAFSNVAYLDHDLPGSGHWPFAAY